nr:uncharacterized protein LOC128679656 isoform X2 [Plodia interpunctella]
MKINQYTQFYFHSFINMWLDLSLFFIVYLSNVIHGAKIVNFKIDNEYKNQIDESNLEKPNLDNLKRIFVKRMVPHGHESKDLEYDKKFNTYFRPLVRVHNGKIRSIPIPNVVPKQKEIKKSTLNELNGFLGYDKLPKKNDDYSKRIEEAVELFLRLKSLQNSPVKRTPSENSVIKKLYDKYKDVVFSMLDKQFGVDSAKKKEFLERAISKIKKFKEKKDLFFTLSKAFTTLKALRTEEIQKIDIVKDSIFIDQEEINQTEAPKVDLPRFPYWNYWTDFLTEKQKTMEKLIKSTS